MKTRGELKLIQQALNNGWAITPKGAADALALVQDVLSDPMAGNRERLRAAKIVLLMESQNIEVAIDSALLEHVKEMGVALNDRLKKCE